MCSVTTRRMQGVGYRDFAAGAEVAESVGRLVKGLAAVGATFGGAPVDPPAAQKLLHSNFLLLRAAFRSKEEVPSTLDTTLGQMAPPKSGRVQECHLIQVAF